MAVYKCSVCDTVFDEEKEGKKWGELAEEWSCHVCESGKSVWQRIDEKDSGPDVSEGKPEDASVQDPALRARLNIEESAKGLENFLRVTTEEPKDFARLTRNDHVHQLSINDLCTTNPEISNYTEIEHI